MTYQEAPASLFSRLRSRSLSQLSRQITPPTKNGHAPPTTKSRKSSQSVNPYCVWHFRGARGTESSCLPIRPRRRGPSALECRGGGTVTRRISTYVNSPSRGAHRLARVATVPGGARHRVDRRLRQVFPVPAVSHRPGGGTGEVPRSGGTRSHSQAQT